jgi:hypothetical protein
MEWPSTLADDDAVIAAEETSSGLRFVVYGRSRRAQFACETYAEAAARAVSYAEHACVSAWYADGRRFQLLGTFIRASLSSPTITS